MQDTNGRKSTNSNQVAAKTTIQVSTILNIQEIKDLQEELWYLAGNSRFFIKDLFLALKTYEAVLDRTGSGLNSSRDDIFINILIYEHVINLFLMLNEFLEKYGDVNIFRNLPKE